MQPIVFLLAVLGLIALGITFRHLDNKRQDSLRAWARGRGWEVSPARRSGWDKEYPGIKLFGKGHSRWGRNVVAGRYRDRPFTLFDYRYTTGHGKNRTNHRNGVVVLHCGFPTIPLSIRRENPFDRVGEFLGMDDIDFESAEFSRKFHVKSADRKWAYDVIHTRTMDYLLGSPAVTIEFGFAEIAVYRGGWCDPGKFEEALEVAGSLYRLIPDYVVQQMKGSDQ